MTHIDLTVQRPDQDTVQVTVHGALDRIRAYDFDDAMRRIERSAPGRLLLDLRSLEYLDTTGLARIAAVRRRCRHHGRRLVIIRGSRTVNRLFAMGCSDEQFELVGDPSEALAMA